MGGVGRSVYERCVAGMEGEFEQVMAEAVAQWGWLTEEDVAVLRRVCAVHVAMVVGEDGDVGMMADNLLWLAQRAGVVGDRRRAWAFGQWHGWACASMRGEEYRWPELPQELAGLA